MRGVTCVHPWASSPALADLLCSELQTAVGNRIICIPDEPLSEMRVAFSTAQMQPACTHCDDSSSSEGDPVYMAHAYVSIDAECDRGTSFAWDAVGDSEEDLLKQFVFELAKAYVRENE
jgi:hypothetical protein